MVWGGAPRGIGRLGRVRLFRLGRQAFKELRRQLVARLDRHNLLEDLGGVIETALGHVERRQGDRAAAASGVALQ